jgi:hypothetical protein
MMIHQSVTLHVVVLHQSPLNDQLSLPALSAQGSSYSNAHMFAIAF